ncbi:MAG: NAD(P)H-dependent glycerol-3-phosphate dehydrogenase [Pseudomonadota bacterium]|nr:NAD(P)H-dependent glycerol-3-phosphate dehydrogenase [Pseudomonadota bacterium]
MKIGIIGAGAWGTALALTVQRAGCDVLLWAYEAEVVDAIVNSGENTLYLPGVSLNPNISATSDLSDAVNADAILLATPAQHLRRTIKPLTDQLFPTTPLVICSKGIEQGTTALMSEVVSALFASNTVMALSGPTFAKDVAAGLPTAVTLAADDLDAAQRLAYTLSSEWFRPYSSDDVIGAQVGGAIKNVLAIACGISDGRGFSENARAALVTRGLAELTRLCVAKGGKAETMMGLSGMGDLVLTCTSTQSRNYSLGLDIGRGRPLADVLAERNSVAEGVYTASAAIGLAEELGVDMPISSAVDAVLNKNADIDEMIGALLARPLRTEAD